MKRTLTIGIMSFALLAMPGCKGKEEESKDAKADGGEKADGAEGGEAGGGDAKGGEAGGGDDGGGATAAGGPLAGPTKLIPDSATVMAHIDLQAIAKTKYWKDAMALSAANPDFKKSMDALNGCNIKPEGLKSVTIGTDGKDKVAAVLAGEGVGKIENLECMVNKLKEEGEEGASIADKDGKKILVLDADGQKMEGHPVDDGTLLFTQEAWSAEVSKLAGGEGTAAVDGKLKVVVGRTDTSKAVWFAAHSGAWADNPMAASAKDVTDVAGTVDFTSGVAVTLAVAASSADKAKELKIGLDAMLPQAAAFGVPEVVTKKLKVEQKDAVVTASLALTDEEVAALATEAAGALPPMGGM